MYKNFLNFLNNKKREKERIHIKKTIRSQFLESLGYEPDFKNPKSFNEKLQWLKLNHRDPLLTQCADKYAVRDYVSNMIGKKYLVPLIDVFKDVDDIDFDLLPNKFVLKVNHGSGQNIICKNKNNFDCDDARKKIMEWMKPESNHYNYSYEWCYKDIEPLIVCEEYLDYCKNDLNDYKFLCFSGNAENLFVCSERQTDLKVDFFDLNWNKLPFTRHYQNSKHNIDKPKNFQLMIDLANKLSKPFPFVRVDFYEVGDFVFFGELTFYPGNGMEPFNPIEWDYKMGDLLILNK